MKSIKKLPQELINQIAAGEVIERPASVVKELLDNSIDAEADILKIRVKNGGLDLIEVSDNGLGISPDALPLAFEAHSTSKIEKIEDLDALISMGFRGEALSTIVAISEVTAISKTEGSGAYKIQYSSTEQYKIAEAARDRGTTVTVERLFGNIPARLKYMKSADTEYRKILQILYPYFIIYPNLSFVLEKDGKNIINLPKISGIQSRTVHPGRFKEVVRNEFADRMIDLFYDGDGLKIGGLIGHPSLHQSKANHIYAFVNGRPVNDRGIIKSVLQGYNRFIPHGERVPFVLMLDIKPDLVDVNVHPRKEEVRFINPYRVYSAIENAVSATLSKEVKGELSTSIEYRSGTTGDENAYNRLRSIVDGDVAEAGRSQLDFSNRNSISDSLFFSETLLKGYGESPPPSEDFTSGLSSEKPITDSIISVVQMFKKYIFVQFEEELWVIDQHAAAERITFEKLLKNMGGSGDNEVQNLLVPEVVALDETEAIFFSENIEFFSSLGFAVDVSGDKVTINAVPSYFYKSDLQKMVKELVDLTGITDGGNKFELDRAKEDIVATIACHNSIRSNQKLHQDEGRALLQQLLQCDNPYSCPHGRPVVWRQSLQELDKKFDRTY